MAALNCIGMSYPEARTAEGGSRNAVWLLIVGMICIILINISN
jgi:hypothetical protein